MKIESGKFYITNIGYIVGPMVSFTSGHYCEDPSSCSDYRMRGCVWNDDGWCINNSRYSVVAEAKVSEWSIIPFKSRIDGVWYLKTRTIAEQVRSLADEKITLIRQATRPDYLTQAVTGCYLYISPSGQLILAKEGEAMVGTGYAPITIYADITGSNISNIRLDSK